VPCQQGFVFCPLYIGCVIWLVDKKFAAVPHVLQLYMQSLSAVIQYLIVCECLGLGEPIQLLMPDLFALPRLASTHIICVPNR
jgi:hypothetical protein